MGGSGSGRWQSGKDTTGDMRALDIRRLQRDGLLTPGRSFGWNWSRNGEVIASIKMRTEAGRVVLNYRTRDRGGEWQPMEYPIYLEWTRCNLGGQRVWFKCPARGCGRRVAILYGGAIFACRHCHDLKYESQREKVDDRAMRRADTIRLRLGWEAGIANPEGGKPNGMHWRTYGRLVTKYYGFANASWQGMAERLGMIDRRLSGIGRRFS